jgi:phosphoribosylformylglycinamidine synthase
LLATVAEMMFASRLGVALENQSTESLFAEEIGAVLQIKAADWAQLEVEVAASSLKDTIAVVGRVNTTDQFVVNGLTLNVLNYNKLGLKYHIRSNVYVTTLKQLIKNLL